MAILCGGGRTGRFHHCADQVGQGIAHLFGDRIQLGAGLGLAPVLLSGYRLGEVLLQLPQLFERQCLEIEISHLALVS